VERESLENGSEGVAAAAASARKEREFLGNGGREFGRSGTSGAGGGVEVGSETKETGCA